MFRKGYFKKIRKGKNIKPLGAFEKNYYLCRRFKIEFITKSVEEKINKLKELARIKINNTNQSYKKRRSRKHPTYKDCWVCKEHKAFCQHHIIQLQHGGYDNGINRIPICDYCHKEIHEWLLTTNKL